MAVPNAKPSLPKLYQQLQVWSRRALLINSIAFIISVYALYVEIRHENDPSYVAHCDISSYISCTKALGSELGRGFGLVKHVFGEDSILNQRNPLFGTIGYFTLALLQLSNSPLLIRLCVIVALALNAVSVYLIYHLIRMSLICIVCYAIHICNLLFFYYVDKRRTIIGQIEEIEARKKRS